jgi:hypothetical protein
MSFATVARLRSELTPFPDVRRHTTAIFKRYSVTAAVLEGAAMQMNEIVGLVQIGARRPKSKRAPNATHTTRDPSQKAISASEKRDGLLRTPGTTDKPVRYGSGF